MTSLVPSDARARLAYKLYDLSLPCRRSYNAYATMYEYLRTNVAYNFAPPARYARDEFDGQGRSVTGTMAGTVVKHQAGLKIFTGPG